MKVNVYRYETANAPSLSGAIGSMIAFLKSILIDGITLPAVTSVTRTGSTATVTFSANHGLQHTTLITLSGLDQAEYNGDHICAVASATTVTFTVADEPATPATGTAAAVVTPMGWTVPYEDTDAKIAVFRAPSGLRHYLRITDATAATNFRQVAYETMSDVSTGTNPYPTGTQIAGGAYSFKSDLTTTAARQWLVLASEKWVYVYMSRYPSTNPFTAAGATFQPMWFFGDIDTRIPGDQYHSMLIPGNSGTSIQAVLGNCNTGTATTSLHYIAGTVAQVAGSVLAQKRGSNFGATSTSGLGTAGNAIPYPDAGTGGLLMSQMRIFEPTTGIYRGDMPRLYHLPHNLPLAHADTFTGTGELAGRDFILLNTGGTTANGRIALDITVTQ